MPSHIFTRSHPHRFNRGGQQVLPLCHLDLLLLFFVGAVLLHGLPAGEVDDPAGDLLPLLLLPLQLHTLEVFARIGAPSLGRTRAPL